MKTIYCIAPIQGILTRLREYEIIKELHNAYVIKRDDGSIDKVDKSRFTIYFDIKQFYCRKNNTCENQCPLCTGGE